MNSIIILKKKKSLISTIGYLPYANCSLVYVPVMKLHVCDRCVECHFINNYVRDGQVLLVEESWVPGENRDLSQVTKFITCKGGAVVIVW